MPRLEDNVKYAARVGQLATLVKTRGNCDIPKNFEDQELARWVSNQRHDYNAGKLSAARIAMLDEIGFNFEAGLRGTTGDINRQLTVLKRYRKETGGDIPAKTDADAEFASLSQWVYRMRKLHHGGQLSITAIGLIEAAGINLERTSKKVEAIQGVTDSAFQKNHARLSDWLDHVEDTSGLRNLAYRDTKTSDVAKKSYSFIEHMALKSRQGILSDEHHTQLCMLAFSVNGRPVEEMLTPKPSIRSPEGSLSNRAQRHAEQLMSQAKEAVAEAEATAQRADEVKSVAEAKLGDAINTLRVLSTMPAPESPSSPIPEKRYLSTDELALRINYDARTIRDRLKDSVLKQGRHYIKPFGGRKILWVWETIDADMRDGSFAILESST